MRTSAIVASSVSAWFMAVVYYQIEVETGVELTLLLYTAIITMTIGLYLGCKENKETLKEETD